MALPLLCGWDPACELGHTWQKHIKSDCCLKAVYPPSRNPYILGTQSTSSPNIKQLPGSGGQNHATRQSNGSPIGELGPSCLQQKQQQSGRQGTPSLFFKTRTQNEACELTHRQSLTQAIKTSYVNTGSRLTEGNVVNPGCLGYWILDEKQRSTMIVTWKLKVFISSGSGTFLETYSQRGEITLSFLTSLQ